MRRFEIDGTLYQYTMFANGNTFRIEFDDLFDDPQADAFNLGLIHNDFVIHFRDIMENVDFIGKVTDVNQEIIDNGYADSKFTIEGDVL